MAITTHFKVSTPRGELHHHCNAHSRRSRQNPRHAHRQTRTVDYSKTWIDHPRQFNTLLEAETYVSKFQAYKIFKVELIQSVLTSQSSDRQTYATKPKPSIHQSTTQRNLS
jgi:hypothetical protein